MLGMILLGLAALTLLWAAPSAAQNCRPIKPTVTVKLLEPRVKLLHANTVTEMNRMFGVRGKSVGSGLSGWHAPGGENSVIIGLTRAKLGSKAQFWPHWVNVGGQYCYSAKKVKVEFGYTDHAVYIPRIYARSSCEYKVVYDHEKQHVKINKQALKKFGAQIKAKLEKKLAKSGVVVVRSAKAGDKAYGKMINAVLDELITQMYRHTNPLHAKIDTPRSYRRMAEKCKKWVKDVR